MKQLYKRGTSKLADYIGREAHKFYPSKNIFDSKWDVMVILDACRYDLMLEVENEFNYLSEVSKSYSVATKTPVWMERTFTTEYERQMAETAYITGNPNSDKFLSPSSFEVLDEVWRYAWDDELGTIRMQPITDRAISVGRTQEIPRLLIHYMQPHEPFLSAPELGGSDTVARKLGENTDDDFRSVWARLKTGKLSIETVWNHYRENLRKVLENIELLIENLDAEKLVITSDHGNAFGEWRIHGHPGYRPIPSLLKVPWIEVSASDSESHEPSDWRSGEHGNVESRLKDLGYI